MKNYLDSRYMAMAWDAMGTTFDSLIDPLFKINSLLARLQDLASDLSQLQEDTPGFFLEANHAIKQALVQTRQAIRAIQIQQERHLVFFHGTLVQYQIDLERLPPVQNPQAGFLHSQ